MGVVLALGLSAGATAQSLTMWGWGGCPTCRVISWVDIATPDLLAGWGFQCQSGQAVDRFDVYYIAADGRLHRAKDAWWITGLWRPDVANYFSGAGCPTVRVESGWHIYLPTPIPEDAISVSVVLWRGSLYETHTWRVNF